MELFVSLLFRKPQTLYEIDIAKGGSPSPPFRDLFYQWSKGHFFQLKIVLFGQKNDALRKLYHVFKGIQVEQLNVVQEAKWNWSWRAHPSPARLLHDARSSLALTIIITPPSLRPHPHHPHRQLNTPFSLHPGSECQSHIIHHSGYSKNEANAAICFAT